MKLKNIYNSSLFKLIIVVLLCLFAILIAVSLSEREEQINFVYLVYLLTSISIFTIGYSKMASIVTLGFGITRYETYRKFNISLLFIILYLFLFAIYYNLLYYLAYNKNIFDLGLLILLSLVVFFSGQLGMMLGNLNLNEYFSSVFIVIIIFVSILEIFVFNYKIYINFFLFFASIILIVINYALIKNIKIEKFI